MKQRLLAALGIILLLVLGLSTSPARSANPTLKSVMNAIIALQNSVNNLGSFQSHMPPAWYQTLPLPSDQRFLLVMQDKAVLDRETGLVWEKSPLHPCVQTFCTQYEVGTRSWNDAREHCMNSTVGGRMGWRLPTIEELASLLDPNNPGGETPYLPPGHPFSNVQRNWYWTATSSENSQIYFRVVDFRNGASSYMGAADYEDTAGSVWCVRGGQGNPWLFWWTIGRQ